MADATRLENQDDFAKLLSEHEASSEKLQTGQKISGKIIAISGDDVFVDVGVKEDGVMDIREFVDGSGDNRAQIGDTVEAFVTSISSQGVRLSRSMSGSGIFALEEARDAGIPVHGRVKSVCKGGYQVEVLGKMAFCPGSQMRQAASNEDVLGEEMSFLITRIENHGRNIVVSHRAWAERERKENLEKLLQNIRQGDIVTGKVARLAPFGAFIELAEGVEGLAHVSELSWSRLEKPEDAVAVGDQIQVKILELGEDEKGRMRISLSAKQAVSDPWAEIGDKLHIGDILEGKVRRIAPFGVFVEILPGVEGLAHISELSWEKRITNPEEVARPGEIVNVKIKDINPDDKRISLSIRDAQGDPWADAEARFKPGLKIRGKVESRSPYGLFVTLAPGLTGLLPAGVIKNSPSAKNLNKLNQGDEIDVIVQSVDCSAKRISLIAEQSETSTEDNTWREHTSVESPANSGIMAQALQKAFQKKQKGDQRA